MPETPEDLGAVAVEHNASTPSTIESPESMGAVPVAHEAPPLDGFLNRFIALFNRGFERQAFAARASAEFVASGEPFLKVTGPQVAPFVPNFAGLATQNALEHWGHPSLESTPPETQSGISEGVASMVSGVTTPAMIGAAAIAPLFPEVAAGVFAGLAAKDAGEKFGEASVAAQQGDTKEVARLTTEGIGSTAIAVAAPLTHMALTGRAAPATEAPAASPFESIKNTWHAFANEAIPRITSSSRTAGESGVRAVTAHAVGRTQGEIFADTVLEGLDVDPHEFGAFIAEDQLRSRKADLARQAMEPDQTPEDSLLLMEASRAVGTFVGAERSPFPTEQSWIEYGHRPEVVEALNRHKQLWIEQKDPLFRQANDLDPETPLPSRGYTTDARINMRSVREDEMTPTTLTVRGVEDSPVATENDAATPSTNPNRSSLIRQMATLRKRDPFAQQFTGLGRAYETDYHELMRNGFGRELPVAAQHDFIQQLVDAGDAVVTDRAFEPDLTLKGDRVRNRLMTLKPYTGRYLQVREPLLEEFDNVMGLAPTRSNFPTLQALSNFFTRSSIIGLAEGTTHASNLLSQIITGAGPTANPLLNALIKSVPGRLDLLYSLPHVIIRSLRAGRPELNDLTAIGATKDPYSGLLGRTLLDPIDRGVRLTSAEQYDNFARSGWIENPTETGKREYINQVGNYNRALQAKGIRLLRDTVQPFATAVHTFNVMGARRLAGSAGIRDLSPTQRLAFAADIYGGWLGFVTTLAALNYWLNSNDARVESPVFGPTGTPLMQLGWLDGDGKLHTLNAGAISGYSRGLQRLGLLPAMEANRRGLSPSVGLDNAAMAVGQTGLNYLTGPLVRTAFMAAFGKTPSSPPHQEAPIVPPSEPGESFDPLKSQFLANVATAAKEANPVVDVTLSALKAAYTGDYSQLGEEAGRKQLSRFFPTTPSSAQSSPDFAEIVTKARLNEYVDDVARRARKLPEEARADFLQKAIDRVPIDLQKSAALKLKMQGAYRKDALK